MTSPNDLELEAAINSLRVNDEVERRLREFGRMEARIAKLEAEIAKARKYLILLNAAPEKRLNYLQSHQAKIGREFGADTCVDDYWRRLIIEEALAALDAQEEQG